MTITDERLEDLKVEIADARQAAHDDAEADQNPQLAIDAVAEFDLDEMRELIELAKIGLQSRRAASAEPVVGKFFTKSDPFAHLEDALYAEGDALASPPASPVGALVAETGSESVDDLRDMALVGHSLMASIDAMQKEYQEWADWAPAEGPAEIVVDLLDALYSASPSPVEVTEEMVERFRDYVEDATGAVLTGQLVRRALLSALSMEEGR